MGVKLDVLVSPQIISLKDLQGKKVAIDGMNMLYQILYNPFQMQKKLPDVFYLDRTQRVITHLYGWIQKITHFYQAKIFPVVVFDGKPDQLKYPGKLDRARNFMDLEKKYHESLAAGNKKYAKEIALNKRYMFTQCIRESKSLLQLMGVPVIEAPSEAEAQCAALQKAGLVDYIVSTDYDALLFGATKIVRQITFQTRKKVNGKWRTVVPKIHLISTLDVKQKLKLSQAQLIDLAILIGCDYFEGIPKIGPMKGLKSLWVYHSIEKMISAHPQIFVRKLPEWKLNQVRNLFHKPIVRFVNKEELRIKSMGRLGLEQILCKDHNLNLERVAKRLDTLEKRFKTFCNYFNLDPKDLDNEDPVELNKFLQRALDRGKKKQVQALNPKLDLCFTPATQITSKGKRRVKKSYKKRTSSSKASKPVKVLKIKEYLRNQK